RCWSGRWRFPPRRRTKRERRSAQGVDCRRRQSAGAPFNRGKRHAMKIRAGFTLGYDCPQPTPMLLCLKVHPSRRADLLNEDILTFNRPIEAADYIDSFGNICTRIVAPAGNTTISTRFTIEDSGTPDPVAP